MSESPSLSSMSYDPSTSPSFSRLSLQNDSPSPDNSKRIHSLEKALRNSRKQNEKLGRLLDKSATPMKVINELEDQVVALKRENKALLKEVGTLQRIQRRHEKTLVESDSFKQEQQQLWLQERRALKDTLVKLQDDLAKQSAKLARANDKVKTYHGTLSKLQSSPSPTQHKTFESPICRHTSPFITESPSPDRDTISSRSSEQDYQKKYLQYQVKYQNEVSKSRRYKSELRRLREDFESLSTKYSSLEQELVMKSRQVRHQLATEKLQILDVKRSLSPGPSKLNQSISFDPLTSLHWYVKGLLKSIDHDVISLSKERRSVIEVSDDDLNPVGIVGSHPFSQFIKVNNQNRLISAIGKVIVVTDLDRRSQSLFFGHGMDVSCLDLHQNGFIVASGQFSNHRQSDINRIKKGTTNSIMPTIIVWNSLDLSISNVIEVPLHHGGISSVAFAKTGTRLLSLGKEDSYLCLLDYAKVQILSKILINQPSKPLSIISSSVGIALSFGINHCQFWTLDIGDQLTSFTVSSQAPKDLFKVSTSASSLVSGNFVLGTMEGFLVLIRPGSSPKKTLGKKAQQSNIRAHDCPVIGLIRVNCELNGKIDEIVVSAGSSNILKFWNSDLLPMGCVCISDTSAFVTGLCRPPASRHSFFYVLLSDNSMRKVFLPSHLSESQSSPRWEPIMTLGSGLSLSKSRLSPVFTSVSKAKTFDSFITSSLDGSVCLWSLTDRSLVKRVCLGTEVCYVDWIGDVIVACLVNGELVLINYDDFETLHWTMLVPKTDSLSILPVFLSLSSDGNYCSVLTDSNVLYLYQVLPTSFEFKGQIDFSFASQLARAIDWDMDSGYLRIGTLDTTNGIYYIVNTTTLVCSNSLDFDDSTDIKWVSTSIPCCFPQAVCLSAECLVTHCLTCNDAVVLGDQSGCVSLIKIDGSGDDRRLLDVHSGGIVSMIMIGDKLLTCANDGLIAITVI
ncbi:hypothetical protein GEMRC1_002120 [Eukaryota sp. GEM-RC1]